MTTREWRERGLFALGLLVVSALVILIVVAS